MGRRSSHTPDELRQLILDSTRSIVEQDGLIGLSARKIASKIEYSAGTIYNVFENLDDLLLTIQVNMLEDAARTLNEVPKPVDARTYVEDLARHYVDFALRHRRLWNLLFQHQLPIGAVVSTALHERVNAIVAIVATALRPLLPKSRPEDLDRTARVLWAAVHGVSAIAVTDKGPTMTTETAQSYAAQLIDAVLNGLQK